MWHMGDRVSTPLGPGTVASVRMEPPDYAQVAAVSVVLDKRSADPQYSGTVFPAGAVAALAGKP